MLIGIGLLTGATTVLFGFGGGFAAVPVRGVGGRRAGRGRDAGGDGPLGPGEGGARGIRHGRHTPARARRPPRQHRVLLLLAAGASAGALATRLAPPALILWLFVAYVVITIAGLLLQPGCLRPCAPIKAPAAGPRQLLVVLAITLPATGVSLGGTALPTSPGAHVHLVGLADPRAAAALRAGALLVIGVLRRRPPHIPDRIYAWSYVGLLTVVVVAMLLSGFHSDGRLWRGRPVLWRGQQAASARAGAQPVRPAADSTSARRSTAPRAGRRGRSPVVQSARTAARSGPLLPRRFGCDATPWSCVVPGPPRSPVRGRHHVPENLSKIPFGER